MEEQIKFIDKEIQRLEDIQKKTYYRLLNFRKVKLHLRGEQVSKTYRLEQLTMWGT